MWKLNLVYLTQSAAVMVIRDVEVERDHDGLRCRELERPDLE